MGLENKRQAIEKIIRDSLSNLFVAVGLYYDDKLVEWSAFHSIIDRENFDTKSDAVSYVARKGNRLSKEISVGLFPHLPPGKWRP